MYEDKSFFNNIFLKILKTKTKTKLIKCTKLTYRHGNCYYIPFTQLHKRYYSVILLVIFLYLYNLKSISNNSILDSLEYSIIVRRDNLLFNNLLNKKTLTSIRKKYKKRRFKVKFKLSRYKKRRKKLLKKKKYIKKRVCNVKLNSRLICNKFIKRYWGKVRRLHRIKGKLFDKYTYLHMRNLRYRGESIDKVFNNYEELELFKVKERRRIRRDRRIKKLLYLRFRLLHNIIKKKKNKLKRGKVICFRSTGKFLNTKGTVISLFRENRHVDTNLIYKSNWASFKKYNLWWFYIAKYLLGMNKVSPSPKLPHYFWFVTYLQLYFYNFLGYKLQWYFFNFMKTLRTTSFVTFWHRFYRKKLLKNFFDKERKFLYILVNIIYFKNIDYLVKIVQRTICNAPLRSHKKYFYNVRSILIYLYNVLIHKKYLLGFTVFFKGKLARKGSVRKSVFFYKYGRVSNSNKSLRTSYRQFLVYTETGVVGCYISLFY